MSVLGGTAVALLAAGALAACGSTTRAVPSAGGAALTTAVPSSSVATTAPAVLAPATAPTISASATTLPTPIVPPTTLVPGLGCPATGRGAVIDRVRQRAWLCDGPWRAGDEMAVTTARSQPLPGNYRVFAKDRLTTSRFGSGVSYLDDFVAFTKGRFTGARIAFHAVPRTAGGEYLQSFDTLGQLDRRGDSAGCIRALPDDARRIWDWLAVGDEVMVIS